MEAIRKAFKDYFNGEDELPEDLSKGEMVGTNGWLIRFVLWKDDDGLPCLDFTADHRMTNPRHNRIHLDGRITGLESYWEMYGWNPDVPGDKERKQQEYFQHNHRISELLRKKGLLD